MTGVSMDTRVGTTILHLGDLTLEQLRHEAPTLASQLATTLLAEETAILYQLAADRPADVRAKVAAIDLIKATGDAVEYLRSQLVAHGVAETDVTVIVARARRAKIGERLRANRPIRREPVVA